MGRLRFAWSLSSINTLTDILSKMGYINYFTRNSICSSLSLKQIILISLRNLSKTISNSWTTGLNPLYLKIKLQPVGHTANITLNLFTILNIFHTIKFHLIELAKIINLDIKKWRKFVTITAYEGYQGLKTCWITFQPKNRNNSIVNIILYKFCWS